MSRWALLLLLALLSPGAWGDEYNPSPDREDVLISLPCNVQMAFRKVYTQHGDSRLSDTRYAAGTVQSQSPMAQSVHQEYIQGPFADEEGFYYLMGKYEVMAAQYEAVMQGKCDNLGVRQKQLPQVSLSWFEAVEFTRRLSLYLLSHPGAQPEGAYVRLPTDSEWEFAARGGLKVSPGEFEGRIPPGIDKLSDYAWHEGAQSANGHLNLPGRLAPNPLGLYDLLGNAQELVLDPFRLTRSGRLHGQSGGFIVRGGSYLTPASQLSSAWRTEKPYYHNGVETRAKDTGLRLVLSLPVASDLKSVRDLNAQVEALGSEENTGRAGGEEHLDSLSRVDELIRLSQEASELALKQNEGLKSANSELKNQNQKLTDSLQDLRLRLATSNTERDEMRDVAVAANLRLGSFLCSNLASVHAQLIHQLESAVSYGKRCLETQTFCTVYQNYQEQIRDSRQRLSALALYYADIMSEAHSTYRFSLFEESMSKLKKQEPARYVPFLQQYFEHLKRYADEEKDVDRNAARWTGQCYATGEGE